MKWMNAKNIGVAVLAFGVSLSANAGLISNGSFELGGFVDTGAADETMSVFGGSTLITDWTVTGGSIAWIGPGHPWGALDASDGDFFLDLTDYSPGGSGGVLQSIDTVIGQTYELLFDLGNGTVYGENSIIASAGGVSMTFGSTPTEENQWDTFSMLFTATDVSTDIAFTGVGTNYNGFYIGLDNVSVDAIDISEPSTLGLMSVGLVLLGYRLRKRNRVCTV